MSIAEGYPSEWEALPYDLMVLPPRAGLGGSVGMMAVFDDGSAVQAWDYSVKEWCSIELCTADGNAGLGPQEAMRTALVAAARRVTVPDKLDPAEARDCMGRQPWRPYEVGMARAAWMAHGPTTVGRAALMRDGQGGRDPAHCPIMMRVNRQPLAQGMDAGELWEVALALHEGAPASRATPLSRDGAKAAGWRIWRCSLDTACALELRAAPGSDAGLREALDMMAEPGSAEAPAAVFDQMPGPSGMAGPRRMGPMTPWTPGALEAAWYKAEAARTGQLLVSRDGLMVVMPDGEAAWMAAPVLGTYGNGDRGLVGAEAVGGGTAVAAMVIDDARGRYVAPRDVAALVDRCEWQEYQPGLVAGMAESGAWDMNEPLDLYAELYGLPAREDWSGPEGPEDGAPQERHGTPEREDSL